jgi:hypothetical protein
MTDRELLELLVQKVTGLEQKMATKDDLQSVKQDLKADIAKLERLANGSMEIIEKTYQELEQFSETQKLHAVWLRRLAADTAQNEAEIALLKKAK